MDERIDLDVAASEVIMRTEAWIRSGLAVGPVTWRDQGDGWPPQLKTDRSTVKDADSIGVQLRKGTQEGEVILYRGGWADFSYWAGTASDDILQEAPGWDDWLTVERFGALLDRLAGLFT